ncbi:MAG TPA: hypothetical protein IAA03_02300 [Candidatus Ruminococcus avistercoris]|nr:hypothetical protein [Candidatus Ruminococcus avistercoris]
MSQEKVDRYKEYKANKQKIWKKEKRVRRLEYIAALVVAAALLGWFGFSVYQKVSDPGEQSAQVYTMDTTAVDEYLQGIMQEE